jgi:hypothetical protein
VLFRTTMLLLLLLLIWLLREGIVTMHLWDSLILSSSILVVVVLINGAGSIVNLFLRHMSLLCWINFFLAVISIILVSTLPLLVLSIRCCARSDFRFDGWCSRKFKRWNYLPLRRCLDTLIVWALSILERFYFVLLLFLPSSNLLILFTLMMTGFLLAVLVPFILPNFAHILFQSLSLFSVRNFLWRVFTDIGGGTSSWTYMNRVNRLVRTIIEHAQIIWVKNLVILETTWKWNFFQWCLGTSGIIFLLNFNVILGTSIVDKNAAGVWATLIFEGFQLIFWSFRWTTCPLLNHHRILFPTGLHVHLW